MANVISVSEAASIGLHAMIMLAAKHGQVTSTHEVAERLQVSEAHLAKVLQRLTRSGLVKSVRGPRGGFRLARAPVSISLREVYESIEGPLAPASCLFDLPVCEGGDCIFGSLLHDMHRQLREKLETTRLEDVKGIFKMASSGIAEDRIS